MTHLTFEQISDLAERAPGAEDREPHLTECGECRETLRKVRALVGAAHALPREVAPDPRLWPDLRERVRRTPRRPARAWATRFAWVAAAAVVVFAAGITVFMPRGPGKAKGVQQPTPNTQLDARLVSHVESNYAATVDDLRRTLDAQRATLAPNTVRVVERSLATIDSAIAEARAALAADPANEALVRILSAHYERKVELLQRATELSSS
jgi:hypothetical protein